jgi:hypothetical protein
MPLIFGQTSLGKMLAVLVDTAGQILTVSQGWIGGAWQKNPLTIGYSNTVERSISNASLAAGANTIDDSVVPAGEVWVITNLVISYTGTVAGVVIQASRMSGGGSYIIYERRTLTSAQWYEYSGTIILKPGDNLRWICSGATLNDDGVLRANGYSFDIDQ